MPPDGEDALITSHFFLFDFLSNAEAYRRYICALVDANYFMRQADRASKGTTGYASVRASDFLKFNVPVPPLATQKAIADVLETSDELTELYESYLERLQTQKRGLMQQLLTGAVRVEVDDSEG
ncbi:restriction endonuclease subunit S [Candidatus Flexifilum breve]|uniref:restriction endonuclease subunit S n=1 Tax=Candidatus Flexifilum breve TaxID=3140694 RepID=UPI0031CC5CC3